MDIWWSYETYKSIFKGAYPRHLYAVSYTHLDVYKRQIYDSDPKVNKEAKKYEEISIQEIIDKKLMAVDLTASIMCLENKMPMLVFGLNEENSIVETMTGTFKGTKVTV